MSIVTIIITGLALSMDAFAVSLASGLADKKRIKENSIKCGVAFGVFQTLMTITGWLIGLAFLVFIRPIDHWISFILLCFIGGKMIYESFTIADAKPLNSFRMLIVLAFATSIDALAAGLSFSSLNIQIMFPAIFIGIITFILSFIGVKLGSILSHVERLERFADVIGGIVLIAIGFKILIEHLISGI
jgi:manganese efflux pump family protein